MIRTQDLRDRFFDKDKAVSSSLISVSEEHHQKCKKRIGIDFTHFSAGRLYYMLLLAEEV